MIRRKKLRLPRFLPFLFLALLIHGVVIWNLKWTQPSKSERTAIETVNPEKLAAIRQQWKEKALLKSKNQDKAADRPQGARFFSDRNIRVEEEQQARNQGLGGGSNGLASSEASSEATESSEPASNRSGALRDFRKFGVRMTPPHAQAGQAAPTTAGDGDQAILDDQLKVGSENLLNAEESVYYSFYSRVYDKVGPIWTGMMRSEISNGTNGELKAGTFLAEVDAVFDSDGYLRDVQFLKSSGVRSFDSIIEKAWRTANHFPQPPKDLINDRGEIHLHWTFRIQLQSEGSFLNWIR